MRRRTFSYAAEPMEPSGVSAHVPPRCAPVRGCGGYCRAQGDRARRGRAAAAAAAAADAVLDRVRNRAGAGGQRPQFGLVLISGCRHPRIEQILGVTERVLDVPILWKRQACQSGESAPPSASATRCHPRPTCVSPRSTRYGANSSKDPPYAMPLAVPRPMGLLAPQSLRCPVSGAIRRVTQTHPQPPNGSTPSSRKLSFEIGEVLIPERVLADSGTCSWQGRNCPTGTDNSMLVPGTGGKGSHQSAPTTRLRRRVSAGLLRLLSRRSPPRPPVRRAPPSRRLAARWPSSSRSRPAGPGWSSPWHGRTCRA